MEMEHEVNLASEQFDRLLEHFLQVFHTRGISSHDGGIELFAEFIQFAHAQSHGGVAQGDTGTFFYGFHSHFPGDRFRIERAENNTALAFQ